MKIKRLVAAIAVSALVAVPTLSVVAGTPFGGIAAPVGNGVTFIEAEDFDVGGNSAFGKDEADYRGDGYKFLPMEGDYEFVNGRQNLFICYIALGDYAEYTINVEVSGNYKLEAFAATGNQWSTIGFSFDGVEVGEVVYETTGWFGPDMCFLEVGEIYLEAGQRVMRVDFIDGSVNVDSFRFTNLDGAVDVPGLDHDQDSDSAVPTASTIPDAPAGTGDKETPSTSDNNVMVIVLCVCMFSAAGIALVIRRYGKSFVR